MGTPIDVTAQLYVKPGAGFVYPPKTPCPPPSSGGWFGTPGNSPALIYVGSSSNSNYPSVLARSLTGIDFVADMEDSTANLPPDFALTVDGFALEYGNSSPGEWRYSATRTRVSFFAGAADIQHLPMYCLTDLPYRYGGGFDDGGWVTCTNVKTKQGHISSVGAPLRIVERYLPWDSAAEPNGAAVAATLPGITFSAADSIDIKGAYDDSAVGPRIQFVVGSKMALAVNVVGTGALSVACEALLCESTFDVTAGALVLPVVTTAPVDTDQLPGTMKVDTVNSRLYLGLDDGTWSAFALT